MVMDNSDGTKINKGFCIPPLTSTVIGTINYNGQLHRSADDSDIIGGIQNPFLLFMNIYSTPVNCIPPYKCLELKMVLFK